MKSKKRFKRLLLLFMGFLLVFAMGCDKEDDIDIANTFKDSRDGRIYRTVTIDDQVWMAENLAFKPSGGNYWAYGNLNAYVETYGYLYDWQTALDVCPAEWRLPADAEWTQLIGFLGGEDVAGGKLKATGTIEAGTGLWHAPNTGATNETGFTALPGGGRYHNGAFGSLGSYGIWWSATELDAGKALYLSLGYNRSDVYRNNYDKGNGFAVRCLRD
ncbi:MAG: fibrobacter succinogenes major paralogous domain-containing protein [Bacteroidales bacterium]|nr:fibrobacter succinogenes major paralogous domain-containing protein [Bacteroidales bacterium]